MSYHLNDKKVFTLDAIFFQNKRLYCFVLMPATETSASMYRDLVMLRQDYCLFFTDKDIEAQSSSKSVT